MRWYHWTFILGAATASPLPPLAFLFIVGLITSLVYDFAPDAVRSLPALPGRAYQQVMLLTSGEQPQRRRPVASDLVSDDNGDGAAEGRTVRLDAPSPAPAIATPQQQGPARKQAQVRERPRWVEIVNDEPDKHPHALILGGTGAGKTTMAKAIIGDRGGRTVVLAPKVSPKGWVNSGAEVATLDDDCTYAPIVQALQDIDEEKRRRSRLVKLGKTPEPLTIVLDDIQDLAVKEPAAGELMVNLSSIGRELNMRLIGIGTTDDALNIRGWKASRNNYVRIETDSDRRGTLSDGKRTLIIHAQESKRLADAARLTPWRGEVEQLSLPDPAPTRRPVAADTPRQTVITERVPARGPAVDLSDLLDDLLAQAVPDAPALPQATEQQVTIRRDGGDVNVYVRQEAATVARATKRQGNGINVRERRRRAEYIKAAQAGEKFEPTYKRLGGSRNDMHALFTRNKPR